MHTLICFALKEEAAPFRKIAAEELTRISQMNTDFSVRENSCNPCQKSGVSILLTGIGYQNAEKSLRGFLNSCRSRGNETQIKEKLETSHIVSCEPDLVLTCGFAGGLNPDLKPGDVIFEMPLTPSLSHRMGEGVRRTGEGLSVKLLASGAKPAKFFCADRIATTVVEKKKLCAEIGADAVEMESAAIHEICREQKIFCATVRVISDTASEDLPLDFNALSKPDKNLDFGKLFLAIAKSPGKIPALMKLQKQTKFAAQQLAVVLEKIIFP